MQELKYLTAHELSKALGVSRVTVFSFVRRGILPRGIKLGHCRRWSVSDVQTALESLKKGVETA